MFAARYLYTVFNFSLKFLPLRGSSKKLSMTQLCSPIDDVTVPVTGCTTGELIM